MGLIVGAATHINDVLPGWTISRIGSAPFKGIAIKSPGGHTITGYSHSLNPGNVIYMLGDELLASQAAPVQATSEPRTWHELKTDPDAWDAVALGIKTHEIRRDDRGFAVGDGLRLRKTLYTGAQMRHLGKPLQYIGDPIERIVSHIQRGYGLNDHWCILSFADRTAKHPQQDQSKRQHHRSCGLYRDGGLSVIRDNRCDCPASQQEPIDPRFPAAHFGHDLDQAVQQTNQAREKYGS